MLLVSRGVKDESQLEEHLERCNTTKRTLEEEQQSLNRKLDSIKKSRQNKILKILELNDFQVEEITQEEISIFVKHIVVKHDKLEVTTMDEEVQEISLNHVM